MELNNNIKEENLTTNYIISGIILTSFFIFVSGYYLGKKTGHENGENQQNGQLLSDKTEYILFKNKIVENNQKPIEIEPENTENQEELFIAELAGFSSIKSAKTCMNKLEQREVFAQLITRNSRTNSGKNKAWYQIVSSPMSKKKINEELKKCNNIIKLSQVILKKAE